MILSTQGLTKTYGALTAVDGVDWSLPAGQIRAIIGPNGAGKTTFFNLVAGVTEPTAGTIEYHGTDISALPSHERAQRGIVKTFQQMSIFEGATVFENIRISAQANESIYDPFSKASDLTGVNERAWRVLERLNLEADHDELVDNLSYGEQRKIEIGIALANDPGVLLLDEPTSGISSDSVGEIIDLLSELSADTELTIVITEHDLDVILDLAEQITVFHQGVVLAEGSPEQIMQNNEVQRVYIGG
jgi:branched-chain amino acid transport system ATP-binding protein